MQAIDQLLAPGCVKNVLVVIGPPGCGKSHKVREYLKTIPNIMVDYVYPEEPDNLKHTYTTVSLTGKKIVRVIDPADDIELPEKLLKFDSKYIIIANSLDNLPSWCKETIKKKKNKETGVIEETIVCETLRCEIPSPTPDELLSFAQQLNPQVLSIPTHLNDYHSVYFWVLFKSSECISQHRELPFSDLITLIRKGEKHPLGKLSPYELQILFNKIIGYKLGVELLSLIDNYLVTGVSEKIIEMMVVQIIRSSEKLIDYRPMFKKRKEKVVEPEFEMGVIKTENKEKAEEPELFRVKSLFDF